LFAAYLFDIIQIAEKIIQGLVNLDIDVDGYMDWFDLYRLQSNGTVTFYCVMGTAT